MLPRKALREPGFEYEYGSDKNVDLSENDEGGMKQSYSKLNVLNTVYKTLMMTLGKPFLSAALLSQEKKVEQKEQEERDNCN